MSSYVTLKFKGLDDVPEKLQKVFRIKGVEFLAGVPVAVDPQFAGVVIKALPAGAFEVVDGEPVMGSAGGAAGVKGAAKAVALAVKAHHADPAAALSGLPSLSATAAKQLLTKEAAALVEAGKLDAELHVVAVAASMLRLGEVAKAAAFRAQALAAKE